MPPSEDGVVEVEGGIEDESEAPAPDEADGELLVVPQEGGISVFTEMGVMEVGPGEICDTARNDRQGRAP